MTRDTGASQETAFVCSASTLDEEVGAAKLSCGQRETEAKCVCVCVRRRGVGGKSYTEKDHTCDGGQVVNSFLIKSPTKEMWSETCRYETQQNETVYFSLSYISLFCSLILLLKEAKPATGRKRLHCNVCLGCVCTCVFVYVWYE